MVVKSRWGGSLNCSESEARCKCTVTRSTYRRAVLSSEKVQSMRSSCLSSGGSWARGKRWRLERAWCQAYWAGTVAGLVGSGEQRASTNMRLNWKGDGTVGKREALSH